MFAQFGLRVRSRTSAIICAFALLLTQPTESWAVRFIICLDPGHGGTSLDPRPPGYNLGADGLDCGERTMNLNVGLAGWWVMNGWTNYTAVLTRTDDTVTPYSERIAIADNNGADMFLSIHHNGVAPSTTAHYTTYGLYCDQDQQAGNLWQQSQELAAKVAGGIGAYFGNSRGLSGGGAIEDFALNGTFHTYINDNSRPAMLGEACGTQHPAANELCDPIAYNTAPYDQAKGYFDGVVFFTGITSVGTSFMATPGSVGNVLLTWEESDPSRSVEYTIYRSDKCWGPWDQIISIASHDATYTTDDIHYSYYAPAPYDREYWFRLVVTDEDVRANATPVATVTPIFAGTPSNVSGSSVDDGYGLGTVTLTWDEASGSVDGYHVYRSRYVGIAGCDDLYEYLGQSTSPSYMDVGAPTVTPLFYRVRSFNETMGSDFSSEWMVVIPPDEVAPDPVMDLVVVAREADRLLLEWSASGDDGNAGTADAYSLRYATTAINEENFGEATAAVGVADPAPAGTSESFWVDGLAENTLYYFAIAVRDDAGNWSTLSNVVDASTDVIAPSEIGDLNIDFIDSDSAFLSWTAPGDDGGVGTATQYDIRYSEVPIQWNTWDLAMQVTGEPTPQIAGTPQSKEVTGLQADTWYYFATKTADEVPNWSVLSNVLHAKTKKGGIQGGEFSMKSARGNEAGGARGASSRRGSQPRGVVLEMSKRDSRAGWKVFEWDGRAWKDSSDASSPSILVQQPDGSGGWKERARYEPGSEAIGVLAPYGGVGRIVFGGPFVIEQVMTSVRSGESGELKLEGAWHSRLGDLTGVTGAWRGPETQLSEGDTLEVVFSQRGARGTEDPGSVFFVVGNGISSDKATLKDLGRTLPTEFGLAQNQPNPFSTTTTLRFDLPKAVHVRLDVFDLQGRRVSRLANKKFEAGYHSVTWDRVGRSGQRVQPGIYLYRIQAGSFRDEKKMVLMP